MQAAGNQVTVYLGPEVEISATGEWTKYLNDDVKRVGTGAGAQAHYHHRDHLKSIRLVTGPTGSEVKRTTYRPFGDKGLTSGSHAETKGYIGERHDEETNYLYLNARFAACPGAGRGRRARPLHLAGLVGPEQAGGGDKPVRVLGQ
ncbi:MAG: hypothetical protein R3D27_04100 [Hyphomicrobiaceae bacterium]